MIIRRPITHQVATELLKNPQTIFLLHDDQTKEYHHDDVVVEFRKDLNAVVMYSTAVHLKEKNGK